MAKQKQTALWTVVLQGVALSLGMYLAGQLLLALLLVKGALPERSCFLVLAVLCVLAATAGGLVCARRGSGGGGRLPRALLAAALFAAVLVAVSFGLWEGISPRGVILLACALGGGVLAGLLGSRGGRRTKRRLR